MSLSAEFKRDLFEKMSHEKVSFSKDELDRASKDETHELIPSAPDVVVFPSTHEDVVHIARVCSKHRINVTPRGAGTGKSGGCVPVHGGIVVDFSKMNRIVRVSRDDYTAVVEPGVILADFQRHVRQLGLYYPPDPASADWCTIGGNIAENAGGPSAVKYGVTKDYLLGLKIVLASGESCSIGKNTIKGVTGLDLVSLLCGSEGVLAFVTQATLRLIPHPKFVATALFQFSSRDAALASVPKIREFGVKCLEYVDESCFKIIACDGYAWMGAPQAKALLIVEVDGDEDKALQQKLSAIDQAICAKDYLGVIIAENETGRQAIWNARKSLSEAVKKMAKHKVSEDVVVPLSNMNALLNKVDKIAAQFGVMTCAFGHAGDGNLHLQFLYDLEPENNAIKNMLKEIFFETIQHDGTLTGEHGVGLAKKEFLILEQDEGLIRLQQMLKKVFDPMGLLNPGKMI